MWSSDANQQPNVRLSYAGYSYEGGICSSRGKYMLVEENGGFDSVEVCTCSIY